MKSKKKEKEKEEWEGIRKWGGNGEKMILLWYHVRIYGIEMEKREKRNWILFLIMFKWSNHYLHKYIEFLYDWC